MRTKFVVYKDNLQPLRNKKIERFIYQIILDIYFNSSTATTRFPKSPFKIFSCSLLPNAINT